MTAPMFGVIVAGRLVQTDFQPVGDTKFMINIPDADNINHIVVFLTGAQPFPDGIGGSVYFSWPDRVSPPTWQLLGFISNNKPSVIFKISKLKLIFQLQKNFDVKVEYLIFGESITEFPWEVLDFLFVSAHAENPTPFGLQPISHVAQIGLSVEPLMQLEMQTPTISNLSNLDSMREFVNKMLESCFNYISSFSITPSQIAPSSTETYIPLNTLQQWYLTFQRRLQQDPNFWKM